MIQETYSLWTKEEFAYPVVGEFIPNIVTYIHDDQQVRPAILVVPGGGYCAVSNSEGEVVAKEFYNKGYNTFVVTYTTNLLMNIPLKWQPLRDLSKAIMLVRKNAKRFHIHTDQIAVCGFSAGGHLTGSLAVHYGDNELKIKEDFNRISNRPDAVILSYPVITTGEKAHRDSFMALLGKDASDQELAYMSLEKHVTSTTPPVFLWHTATDEAVPVENSILFADACKEQGVPYEIHVFSEGQHGLSLANEEWASYSYGGDYTMQQLFETLQNLVDNGIELPEPFNMFGHIPKGLSIKEVFKNAVDKIQPAKPDKGIASWPELAHHWLGRVLN
ncbi:alpha/beta hydrolase [Paenibacillus segetis]|uniref:BD-FAE-like domain-containing protein n=1 Tax=Paenibacillus segetis TaxID=1325360 RepID=A0ABQ1YRP7_9BACL|nr:alpha/beta hydrolase [Paenibacillus segetis]GGH35283.1 hypothetical protein GCM10008013_41510 [Paenibacillus segetis]